MRLEDRREQDATAGQRGAHRTTDVKSPSSAEPALRGEPGREPPCDRVHLATQLREVVARGAQELNLLEERLGLGGVGWTLYWHNAVANTAVAFAGYLLFGGWRLFSRATPEAAPDEQPGPLEVKHLATLAVLLALVVAVVASAPASS